jgi:hypothetical protein
MNVSRRWFLKSAAMAAVATQLPGLFKGHRVLFIDDSAHFIQDHSESNGIIKGKVVNGLWDMVLDTNRSMLYGYSNPKYGYDADCTEPELKLETSYKQLAEIEVSKSVGEVTEDLKPRTYMTPKFEEFQEQRLVWEKTQHGTWIHKRDANGRRVWETVTTLRPVMGEEKTYTIDHSDQKHWVPDSWDGPGHYEHGGILTFTYREPVMEERTYDPLHGAGIDYNAVIEAAKQQRSPWSYLLSK